MFNKRSFEQVTRPGEGFPINFPIGKLESGATSYMLKAHNEVKMNILQNQQWLVSDEGIERSDGQSSY